MRGKNESNSKKDEAKMFLFYFIYRVIKIDVKKKKDIKIENFMRPQAYDLALYMTLFVSY